MSGLDDNTGDDFDGGWDNRVTLVDGRWVDRTPRFPDREAQLRREVELLPWLAPLLPLPVPVPQILSEDPLTVRHEYLPGGPCPGTSPAHGSAVGDFLRALHDVDPDDAVRHGARDASAAQGEMRETLARMERDVLPLLPHHVASIGRALVDRMATPPPVSRLVHGDLGPEHIRVVGEQVGGVIDWGDTCVTDPAVDLAWTTLGSAPAFADAVLAAYRPDEEQVVRARDWHLLGPWHEVLYGLGSGGPAFVESGLEGAIARLERFGRSEEAPRTR
ncbi:MAG: aminoglycoside phosphotransferase family protein [Nocardioides sp.]|nr:aminoglycoside phosphotransferase family protein [Nocardioides sp.]